MSDFRVNVFEQVFGWLGGKAVDALEYAAQFQTDNGITGDALEIGVFQGKFFLALERAIAESDIIVAIDIFDNQELNIDGSGAGGETFRKFMSNVERFATDPKRVKVLSGDSMVARPADILGRSPRNGYRLISVDGGHTAEHLVNDLLLASSVASNGAAVFVDDWMSPHWPGVHEGYNRFMASMNRSLAPVLYADNKLLMTTIGHQPKMISYIRERFAPWPGQSLADVSSHGFKFISAA